MITYNGIDLFSSGPSLIEPGPTQSRDAVADAPGAIGASVIGQGRGPRSITQRGTLVADSEPGLRALIDAIDAQVGTDAATLSDPHGNDYAGCVMRAFEHASIKRLGPRYACHYTLAYLQTTP